MISPSGPSPLHRLALFSCLVLGLGVVSCDKKSSEEPSNSEASAPLPAATPDSENAPEEDATTQEPATDEGATASSEAEAAPTDGPLLELTESEDGKTLTVTGRLSSEYQIRDLKENLKLAFPESTIEFDVKHRPDIAEVVWGNRVTDLLIPFAKSAESAHFHYEKGITTLGGIVEEARMSRQIHQMTSYVMEADDSEGITNELTTK